MASGLPNEVEIPAKAKVPYRRVRLAVVLLLLLVATVGLRCWNWGEVFMAERVFFVDPDSYSRMTRVAKVYHEPGTVLAHHTFENWPQGTTPHTTVPLDYATAGLAWLLTPFSASSQEAIDRAGAWISPLLGVGIALVLALWALRLRLPFWRVMVLFFAVNPILVQGTLLGRPDHQSLQLLLLAIALGAEVRLLSGEPSRRWGLVAGAAWGLACWVSAYEPLVLLVVASGLGAALAPRRFFHRARLAGWAVFAGVLALALGIEGWRSPVPDPLVAKFFPFWAKTIGEMNSMPPWASSFLRWSWLWLWLSPLVLLWPGRDGAQNQGARFWCGLLLVTWGLSAWQGRWGYFFALVFVMSLPWQLALLGQKLGRWRWAVVPVVLIGLWPIGVDWRSLHQPSEQARRAEQRREQLALRELGELFREHEPVPLLAPWWFSPALAYWSGSPCVAGSSHQSLPGIVDSALFYLTEDPEAALRLLDARGVRYVIAYDPGRLVSTSSLLLGGPETLPPSPYRYANWLYTRPNSPPPGLTLVWANAAFRVFRYDPLGG